MRRFPERGIPVADPPLRYDEIALEHAILSGR
jgi:hypothetical protein